VSQDDRYLWDGGGTPDPEIQKLEQALRPLRAPAEAPELPLPARPRRWLARAAVASAVGALAAAAAVVIVLQGRGGPGETDVAKSPPADPGPAETERRLEGPSWPLEVVSGSVRIGGREARVKGHMFVGEVLETAQDGKARLEVPSLGSVEVDGVSRVELVSASGQQRLRLHMGELEVSIYAPPGKFYVETPAGTAVDLGCAYTVSVDSSGNGRLEVRTGWVGFRLGARESLLPAGAECRLRAGHGPGTPRLADASDHFRRAVTVLDGPASQEDQAFALGTVVSQARPQDAFTLWHLLDRLPPESRPAVLKRLVQLVPEARAVPRKRVLAGDQAARDALWDRLGLDPITHWRRWSADIR
jgi:ferric-dicitrate binding protein FerR (iron transport regulator)